MDKREISQRRYRIGGWANLLEPKLSRLARRQQICFQGRMKGIESFPGDSFGQ